MTSTLVSVQFTSQNKVRILLRHFTLLTRIFRQPICNYHATQSPTDDHIIIFFQGIRGPGQDSPREWRSTSNFLQGRQASGNLENERKHCAFQSKRLQNPGSIAHEENWSIFRTSQGLCIVHLSAS